jgi:demethylmenaquinone methyltransferase/2-methoxy-6-polyprenyl-1,4-benzoquinol methylase
MDVKAFFNERGAVWDYKTPQDPEKLKTVLRLSDLKRGCCVLDVGCGTGLLESYLLDYEPSVVLAVDFAENMIAVAKEKRGHPAVEFVCADYFDIKEFTFDNVFFINTFPHFADPKRAVEHLLGLLKKGGRVTISHSQGKSGDGAGIISPMLPAQGLLNLLRPYFRLDVMVDNNALFMISGVKI